MRIRSNLATVLQNPQFAGFVVGNQLLQGVRSIASAHALDADDLLVLGTIATGNLQRGIARRRSSAAADVGDVGCPEIVPMSRSAVSRATALPRETVRRRVNRLITAEWVQDVGSGLIAIVNAEANLRNQTLIAEVLTQFSTACNMLLTIDAIQLIDSRMVPVSLVSDLPLPKAA